MNVKRTSRTCSILILFAAAASPAWAAPPAKVQSAEKSFTGQSSGGVALSQNVSSGNLLTVQIVQWDANGGHRTASVSDSAGNSYVKAARQVGSSATGSNCVEEWYAKNVKAGTVTVTVSYGAGNNTGFDLLVKEIAGADTVSPLDQTATFDEGAANLAQHDCAGTAGITTAANVYISGSSVLNSSGGTITPGTGYARINASIASVIFLDQSSAASLAGTRGDYKSTITRGGCGCLVSYKAAVAGGGTGTSAVAPKKVQSSEKSFTSQSSGSVALSQSVSSGNLLSVQIVQWDANGGHRTASISDSAGNAYVKAARQVGSSATGSNCVEEWYAKNVNGGTVTVTVSYGTGNNTGFDVLVKEITGADPVSPLDQTATFDEGAANLTQHDCAGTAGITTAANVYISGSSVLNSSGGTITPGTGYAQIAASFSSVIFLDQSSATSLAGTRGDYKSTITRGGCGCLVSYKAPAGAPPAPTTLYVSTTGSDTNPGTLSQPLLTLGAAVSQIASGGAIFVNAGSYSIPATLPITTSGLQIAAVSGATVTLTHGSFSGPLFDVSTGSVTIQGFILDGQFTSQSTGIRGEPTANLLTVSNCEIKQFAGNGISLDGADCKISGCQIHHCLAWDQTLGIQPAHGITTLNAQRLTISNCTIHQVSGDAFLGDQGAWEDVTIDGCTFYDAPLESALGGFQQGAYVSESGVKTNVPASSPRARMILRNSTLHTFYSGFVESSTVNLQGQVDVVVDSCDVYDSHLAVRMSGASGDTGAWPTIFNCTIHDSTTAIRYENSLNNLHLVFNTFNNCGTLFVSLPTGTSPGTGWIVQNNLFVGASSLPQEAPAPANAIPASGIINTATLLPTASTGILGTPLPSNTVQLWYPPVTKDKAGVLRSTTTPTMGAYEFVPAPGSPPPPPSGVPAVTTSTHPHFWPAAADVSAIVAKAGTTDGKAIVAQALACAQGAADQTGDRMMCCAFFYRFGSQLGVSAATCQALGAQGVTDLVGFAAQPIPAVAFLAVGYDWLFPLLTSTQQQTVLTGLGNLMNTRDDTTLGRANWTAYNAKAGDGMCLALATTGEISGKDYITDFWQNNWNSTATSMSGEDFWNWYWVRQELADCPNNEGLGYYIGNCQTNWATKALFETATGSNFLKIGWFERYPLWFLMAHEPGFPPYDSGFPFAIFTKNYEGGLSWPRGGWDMLRGATGGPNGAIARWVLDQSVTYQGGISTPGQFLLFGLLMGDPRVKGVDPGTLGTSMQFTTQYGDVHRRSSWASDATCLFFGNNRWTMRSVSPNGLAIFKRVPLLIYRGSEWFHTYEPGDFGNVVAFYSGTQMAIVSQTESTINIPGIAAGTMTQNADGSWTGDALKNYKALAGFTMSQVTRSLRTVAPSTDLSTIVVTDDVACDPSLAPHVVWNMPTQPTVNGRTISFTGADNLTTCTLTMDQDVPQIKVIGGFPTHYLDAFDGTTPPSNAIDPTFPPLTDAQRLHRGGYWRVHVVLPAGGVKIVTTIVVK